jgi:hypothetical protein
MTKTEAIQNMIIGINVMDNVDIVVEFHFVSGESLKVNFSKDKFNNILECLKKGWDGCFSIGENFGLNFSLVTHYEVSNYEDI